jgi:hypothetical protein
MLTHEDPADLNISDELDRDMDPYTMPAGPSRTVQQRVPEKRKMSQADDLKCTQSGCPSKNKVYKTGGNYRKHLM